MGVGGEWIYWWGLLLVEGEDSLEEEEKVEVVKPKGKGRGKRVTRRTRSTEGEES